MVLDTSAIVAAIANEPDGSRYHWAKSRSQPLLFKGDDFARTDVVSALA